MNKNENAISNEQLLNQLRVAFAGLPNDILIYHFFAKDMESPYTQANRQIIRAFRELTDKITLEEYDLDHELATKWQVDRSPTLLIAPDKYNIRWLGAPMGEEGRTFLEALLLVGAGNSQLNDDARTVLKKIDQTRKLKVFVSSTCPYCPQEAVNGIKSAIENPLIEVEIIDIQANPDLADRYDARSVPQAYANEILIGQGARSEEVFAASLEKMTPVTVFIPENEAALLENDLVIIGAGPAGLTAGIYAARAGLKAAVLERNALGGQVATTPVVENYPGFTQIGGKSLVDIMVSHALEYVPIFQGEAVLDIHPGHPIVVHTSRRKFHTKTVLFATGASHRHLEVMGEDRLSGSGVSYCTTCDGPLFRGKEVLMVGGGNSAVTEALHLHHTGVRVTLVHRGERLRAQDALVQNLKDNQIPILWNTEIQEIRGHKKVESVILHNNKTGETTEKRTDGVFISIGYKPTVDLAQHVGLELTSDGYIRHDGSHRTNIPGIYSAGDVEGGYKQIVTATGQGAAAALVIFEDLINPYWRKKI